MNLIRLFKRTKQTNPISLTLNSPFGIIRVTASASNSDLANFSSIQVVYPTKSAHQRVMSVSNVEAVVFTTQPDRDLRSLIFECLFDTPPCKGGAESGEWLDAQSWEDAKHKVMIGTEDFEVLRGRLPHIALKENPYPIDYLPNGLRVNIPSIKAGDKVSLHFVLAWNQLPELDVCATWDAVNIPHGVLLSCKNNSG